LFVYWLSITHPRPVARNGGPVFASAFFVGHEVTAGGRPPYWSASAPPSSRAITLADQLPLPPGARITA
jgi:hypothetical protein